MTPIAPALPRETHSAPEHFHQPAIWIPAGGSERQPECLAGLLALGWSQWVPTAEARAAGLGAILAEFARSQPGRPLLQLKGNLWLDPDSARRLEAAAAGAGGAVVLSALSNAAAELDPFAGLDISALVSPCAAGQDTGAGQTLARLVGLLGTGRLFPLSSWHDHLLYFSPAAIELLARTDPDPAAALACLHDGGGRLLLSDRILAWDDRRPSQPPPRVRRPVPWGMLQARIADWLDAGADHQSLPLPQASPATLHITHSWGGGVARWVESCIEADPLRMHYQLRSEGTQPGQGAGQRLSLYAGNELRAPVARWWLDPAIGSTADAHPRYREILAEVARRHGIGRVIVSSLVGHSLDALRTGLPTVQVLHDCFPAWPLLDVSPEPYLGLERPGRLDAALRKHALLADFRDRDAERWNHIAEIWRETAAAEGVHVVAPSRSAAATLRQLDPGWERADIAIIPHGLPPWQNAEPVSPRERADGRLRLVVPGRIQQGKGAALLLSALPRLKRVAQVYLVGAGKDGEQFFGREGVNIVLQYRREDLPGLLQQIGPDAAALLSTVPETFSYTLSEMQQLGIPVIATRIGSLAERIEEGRNGWLIDVSADALVERVTQLAADRTGLARVRSAAIGQQPAPASAMLRQYDALCPALARRDSGPEPEANADEARQGALAQQQCWLERELRQLSQQAVELQAEVEKRSEWARERDRALADEQQQRERWVTRLEDDIRAGQAALRREEEAHGSTRSQLDHVRSQLELVLGSASWRLTRPLRAARRMLANLRRARAWNPARWPLLLSQCVRLISTGGLRGALLRWQSMPQQGLAADSGPTVAAAEIGSPEPPASLPFPDQPRVSVIIPVFNQWAYTAACLRSLASARCAASFEVIVVDDHSGDETAERLRTVTGLVTISNRRNRGFIASCNRGLAAARGDYVVLLNNDTQVPDGWLDTLLATFEQFPDTGLAGARLCYPDGRLQECGGIVFRDGSGWNYGRGDRADKPEYAHVREVDYCSGACIMLPAGLFRELGGLDANYAPAYYEDTDLAFRVRAAGFRVRVQPAASVIHFEGVTSGTDTGAGTKRFQPVNRRKFASRWQAELAACPAPIADPLDAGAVRRARDHRLRGRVLLIDAYTPEPDQDSGSQRLIQLFDCLQQLGYGVTFFADNRGHAGPYTEALQRRGVEVLYNPWLEPLGDFFRARGPEFDFVIVCRHYVAANYLALVRKYCPRAKFIFDTVDLHYLREQRMAELKDSLPLRRAAAQTRRSELALVRAADATLVVSPVEQDVLAVDAPGARIHLLSNIHRVAPGKRDFAQRSGLLFVGGYQHPPNVDAASWFVGEIWPLVRAELPGVEFHLIGSKAPDAVRRLHGNGVVFHGYVADLEPWLENCRIAVAPLRYGAGVKGKVNLSMSRGQPVVATPVAVEGLHAQHGHDILVAESAEEFAAAVIRLYRDEALWKRLAAGGLENVRRHFSPERARESLGALFRALGPAA